MKNFKILVATESEKLALIPEEYWDDTIITGMGFRNVIRSISGLLKKDKKILENRFINIGFAGSIHGKIGDLYEVEYCETIGKHIYYNLQDGSDIVKLLPKLHHLKKANCYTAFDFVTAVDENSIKVLNDNAVIFDMELAAILSFNSNANAYKIVSDNLEEDSYKDALKASYVENIRNIINQHFAS